MTIGIYAITFDNDRLVYIGQSVNIEARWSRHKRECLTGKHHNQKVQAAYDIYGEGVYTILEHCCIEALDELEDLWIEQFDSFYNGLNLTYRDKSSKRGPDANSAKFTKEQVEMVFNMLLDESNTIESISKASGMPIGSINSISRGASHRYLEELYPDKYSELLLLVGSRRKYVNTAGRRGIKYPPVISPDGVIYRDIQCIKDFCKEHDLGYDGFLRFIKGTRYNGKYKKWKILDD